MKKRGFIVGLALLTALVASFFAPAVFADEHLKVVSEVSLELQPTDEKLLEALVVQGIDKNYVELVADYGLSSEGKSSYSITYKDLKSSKQFLLVSGLPQADAFGDRINPSLFEFEGKYYSNSIDNYYNNIFWLEVDGTQVTAVAQSDQPYGISAGERVIWNPQLFLDGVEQFPTSQKAVLLSVDPVNPNYSYNTLRWDYGIATRTIRAIEGSVFEKWLFDSNPGGEVRIQHNHTGTFPLEFGSYAIDDDTELVPALVFSGVQYPFLVGASATFYPDAGVNSVDGYIYYTSGGSGHSWSTVHNAASGMGWGDNQTGRKLNIKWRTSNWDEIDRHIFLFYTASLPDDADISAVTLSLYGYGKTDALGISPTLNIYSSNPVSNTGLGLGDYSSLGTTAYSDTAITYAGYNTAGYNDFALNATGIAAVNKTGVSKFGAREATYDAPNIEPTNGFSDYYESYFEIYFSEQGSGYEPKLVVTYTTIVAPTVTTQAVTNKEDTTATGNGNITNTGGENADYRGVAWDTVSRGDPGTLSPAASSYTNYSSQGPGSYGTGAFTRSMTSLPAGTTVYARAYAHNSADWNWGAQVSFLTKPAAPTSVAATDGTYNDKVRITWTRSTGATNYRVYEGSNNIGGLLGDVAIYDDSAASAGSITAGSTVATDGGQTAYVSLSLSGTSTSDGASRTYKVVAVNATGNSDDSGTNNGYRGVGALSYQWQRSAGDSDDTYGNIGGATSSTYNDTASPAGSISNSGTASASDGASSAYVTLSLASEATTNGAGRYFRSVLTADGASGQTSASNRGYRGVGSITYQWQRSAADSDASYGNIGGGTTDPYNDTGAPADGSGRYFQAIVSSVDASNTPQTSTNDRGYRLTVAPTVTTQSASSVEETTATGNGNITATGGPNADYRGIAWDTTSRGDPGTLSPAGSAYSNYDSEGPGSYGTGAFTRSLTSLTPGATYYARAYAHNSVDWNWGNEITFYTKPEAPTSLVDTDRAYNSIDLSWTKGTGSEKTMIRYRTDQYPTGVGDGTQAYYDTSNSTTVGGLSAGQIYYFRAWAWDTNSGYSDLTNDDTAYTLPGDPSALTDTGRDTSSIDISWTKGTGGDYTMVRYRTDQYPTSVGDGTQAYYNTSNSTTVGGLSAGQIYYFRAWARDTDSNYYSGGTSDDIAYTIPGDPSGFTATTASDTQIDLSWTKGTGSEKTMIRRKEGSYPTGIGDGDQAYFDTGTAENDIGRTPNTLYYYRAWAYDTGSGYYSDSYVQDTATTYGSPIVTTSSATNEEETTATVGGNITATNGANASTRGFEYDTDSGAPYASDWNEIGSFGTGAYTRGLTLLTKGELYYYRAYAINTYGTGYGAEDVFLTKPDEPNTLAATPAIGEINLTWVKGTGALNTYIRGKDGSYPTNRADGYLVYNSTGTSATDSGLIGGHTYYYRAWSYATEGGEEQYSDNYDFTFGSPDLDLNLWFQPNDIISGTTMPDRSTETNTGTITWGANASGVSIIIHSLTAYTTGVSGTGEMVVSDVGPVINPPSEMFPGEAMEDAGPPWLRSSMTAIADMTDTPVGVFWILGVAALVLLSFTVVFKFTQNLMMAGLSAGIAVGASVGMSLLPPWFMIVAVSIVGGLVIMERQGQL